MSVLIPGTPPFTWNLALAWIWILAGFVSGAVLGLCFHKEEWLGGYGAWQRRLYRLGHISFFGTGIVNLLFFVTVAMAGLTGPLVVIAAWALLAGALTMPVACLVAASRPAFKSLFYLPVGALLAGANGCFILGLDGDTPAVFEDVLDFHRETGQYEVQITLLTAFPGTSLYARMKQAGRLLHDGAWDRCTLFDLSVAPANMTCAELQTGFVELARAIYSAPESNRRRREFRQLVRNSESARRTARRCAA